MRTITRVKREWKFVTTAFLILLFLIISLIPYFASILVEADCSGCRGQKWLIALRESSVVFLFLNETVIANHDGDGSENEAKLLRSKT